LQGRQGQACDLLPLKVEIHRLPSETPLDQLGISDTCAADLYCHRDTRICRRTPFIPLQVMV